MHMRFSDANKGYFTYFLTYVLARDMPLEGQTNRQRAR